MKVIVGNTCSSLWIKNLTSGVGEYMEFQPLLPQTTVTWTPVKGPLESEGFLHELTGGLGQAQ